MYIYMYICITCIYIYTYVSTHPHISLATALAQTPCLYFDSWADRPITYINMYIYTHIRIYPPTYITRYRARSNALSVL